MREHITIGMTSLPNEVSAEDVTLLMLTGVRGFRVESGEPNLTNLGAG